MQPINFNLSIGVIKISNVEQASAVNIGKNLLIGWQSHSKSNQGLGNINGDSNDLQHLMNHLQDPDGIDFLSSSNENTEENDAIQKLVRNFLKEDTPNENESG